MGGVKLQGTRCMYKVQVLRGNSASFTFYLQGASLEREREIEFLLIARKERA